MLIGGLLLDDMPLGRRETPAKGCGCHGCGIRSSSAPAFYRSASGQSQMPEPRSSVVGSRRGGRTRFVFFSAMFVSRLSTALALILLVRCRAANSRHDCPRDPCPAGDDNGDSARNI